MALSTITYRSPAPPPTAADYGWHLRTLDGFALVGADGDVPLQPAAQRLLALLAVHTGPAERAHVAGVLWMDTSDPKAAANLRSLLWRLRSEHEHLVAVSHTRVELCADVDVDLHRSRRRAGLILEGEHVPDPADIRLLTGDLLPGWYDDWVIIERERMRQRRLHALEQLCASFTSRGQFALALEAGLEAVAAEPLRESAHRAVVATHLAEGNATEAVRVYREYAELLDAEMGLSPTDHMLDLVAPVLQPPRAAHG